MKIVIDIPEECVTPDTCFIEWVKAAGDKFEMTILPKEHGRLIDADAAKCSDCGEFGCKKVCSLYNAPTIIEADGGAE